MLERHKSSLRSSKNQHAPSVLHKPVRHSSKIKSFADESDDAGEVAFTEGRDLRMNLLCHY